MSHPAPDPPYPLDSPRLLALRPSQVPARRTRPLPFPDTFLWLELLTTILGAPSAVPADLWAQPLRADPQAILRAILRHVQNRIPQLEWDMLDTAESVHDLDFLEHIPVYPFGFDTCNGEFETYGPATALLAHLDGFDVSDLLWSPQPSSIPPALHLAPLLPILNALPPPLNGIAVIIAMLHHTTGTMLLDACPSCYHMSLEEMLEWTDENLTWLEQDAALAHRIHRRAYALETWVATNPIPRLKTIWYAIRRAHRTVLTAPPRPQGPFTISAEDFVAGKVPVRPKTLIDLWGGAATVLKTTEEDPDA
jgi:hypothetical protein